MANRKRKHESSDSKKDRAGERELERRAKRAAERAKRRVVTGMVHTHNSGP